MSAENVRNLDNWREASLEQWTDTRIVDQAWVDTQLWFFLHSYADFAESGLELVGFSFREKHGDWDLILKLDQGDIPLVAFVTSKNPTRCMSKLRKLLRNGGLALYQDKFR